MTWSKAMRQPHRWRAIAFTGADAVRTGLIALLALVLLLATGLCRFALPHARGARPAGERS
jgi:hypothetical protein